MNTFPSRFLAILFILVILAPALLACSPTQPLKKLTPVTVQLAWFHQAQFAGFYAADQQGYYTSEGLKVTLLPRQRPEADTIAPVIDGKADFGLTYGSGLVMARSLGQPVTAIATIFRRYPMVFITLASSGITKPHEFPGHTVRTLTSGGSALVFNAMMRRLRLNPDSVRQVDVGFDLSPFFARKLDIWPGFIINEVLIAREQGYQVNLIFPEDYGVHMYGDTLFTAERLIQEKPDLVRRFLRATLKGWTYAVENPTTIGPMVVKYKLDANAKMETDKMTASIPLVNTGEDHIGWMKPDIWTATEKILREEGILTKPVDITKVYTLQFLKEIYEK